jgi:hypothetical protein
MANTMTPNYLYVNQAEAMYAQPHLRDAYLHAVEECQKRPIYFMTLPTGTLQACVCEPLLNDKTNLLHREHPDGSLGSWKTVRYNGSRKSQHQ